LGFKIVVNFTPMTNLGNLLRLKIVAIEFFRIINVLNWQILDL
jgi:hypothetical protein